MYDATTTRDHATVEPPVTLEAIRDAMEKMRAVTIEPSPLDVLVTTDDIYEQMLEFVESRQIVPGPLPKPGLTMAGLRIEHCPDRVTAVAYAAALEETGLSTGLVLPEIQE